VFLVLLNKASRLMTRKGEFTGWLYGVARNVCLEALRKRAKRQEEAMLDETEEPVVEEYRPAHEEVLPFLDEELAGLTGVLRQAVVLRYLQNHSEAEAAQRAGCAVGTLSMRASRGIERLRQRLAKRGVALGGAALAGLLTSEASAAVPETLLPSILATVKTAVATTATATGASSTAAMLAKGAMKAMFIAKVKMVAAIAAAVIVTGTAVPVGIAVAQAAGKAAPASTNAPAIGEDAKAMFLRAMVQAKAKDYESASQTIEALLRTYPDEKAIRSEALYWLGDFYSKVENLAAAKRAWEQLNAEFPDSRWGKYGRGRVPDYLVVDLSGGPSASNYPVGYLSAVPSGGWTDEYKTTKLVLRKIPAGTFTMGSPTNELGRSGDETQHTVTVSRAFCLGVFEVTQRQWELVMGNKPSYFTNATCYATRPVERVSYYDIRESTNNRAMSPNWPATNAAHADSFMGKLRAKTGLTGFDLPTESQWEYACRGGTDTALNSGYNLTNPTNDAQMNVVGRDDYNGPSTYGHDQGVATNGGTAAAGSYQANAWGLYDMHGNVFEWCLDWHGTYPGAVTDPKGAASGSNRVLRGGNWMYGASHCRSAFRYSFVGPDYRINGSFGFRAAMTLP
jgi:RNA polymerase sigma factor (sigma-70 family)